MARTPQIVLTETGQIVPGAGRSLTSYQDELRWRKRLQKAVDDKDPAAELNARRMLNSIFQATVSVPPEPSPVERFAKGAASLAAGINQLLPPEMGGFTPEQEASFAAGRRLYEQALPPGIDWPALAGEAAVATPFMALPQVGLGGGLLGRTAAGVGGGGIGGGALFAESPQERLSNIVAGAAGGGLGAAAIPPLARAVGGAAGAMGAPLGFGQARAARALEALGPEAQERMAQAERFGFTGEAMPTRGQLTQDPMQLGEEFNLAAAQEVGAPLAARRTAQELQTEAALGELQAGAGGPIAPGEAGAQVMEAAQQRAADWQLDVQQRYEAAKAARPDARIAGDRLKTALQDVVKERRNSIPPDVRRRIKELTKAEGGIEPVELENLDKLMSDYVGPDRARNAAIRIMKDRIRNVMDDFAGEYGGIYREAVGEASKRFRAMGKLKDVTNQLVREAIDPIKVVPRIKSAGLKELTALRDFVSDAAPEQWQALRSGILSDVIEKTTQGGRFSQATYNRALRQVGRERMKILFGEEATNDLFDFGRVVQDLYGLPKRGVPNVSGSGIRVMNALRDRMMNALRFVPGARGLAREITEASQRRAVQQALDPFAPTAGPPTGGLLETGATAAGMAGLLEAREARERQLRR